MQFFLYAQYSCIYHESIDKLVSCCLLTIVATYIQVRTSQQQSRFKPQFGRTCTNLIHFRLMYDWPCSHNFPYFHCFQLPRLILYEPQTLPFQTFKHSNIPNSLHSVRFTFRTAYFSDSLISESLLFGQLNFGQINFRTAYSPDSLFSGQFTFQTVKIPESFFLDSLFSGKLISRTNFIGQLYFG